MKSPAAMLYTTYGLARTDTGEPDALANAKVEVGLVTTNDTTFDVPPPGPGFTTVTLAVVATAASAAGTVAVQAANCGAAAAVHAVESALPFQSIADRPFKKPVPWTVRVKFGAPGETLTGETALT